MENTIKIVKLDEQMKQVSSQLVKLDKKLDKNFKEIKDEMKCYVRREEFMPYKRILDIVFGVVITTIIGAVLYLIIK